MKRALFSVDNLENVVNFAADLRDMGWQIVATAETVAKLQQHEIEVVDVSDFSGVTNKYGFPPTLHPKIEAALTLDVSFRIDLVYDIPYSHKKGNDVGGNTLLALGAKGNRIVVFTAEDMKRVIDELKKDPDHREINNNYHRELIYKTQAYISEHYLNLARNGNEGLFDGIIARQYSRLLNGENPYQVPADLFISYNKDKLSLDRLHLQSGDIPCFTNLADIDSILYTLCLAADAFRLRYKKIPYIAIAAKHGNPCGMAVDWNSPQKTILDSLFGNPLAIWGGEFISNFSINADLADLLYKNEDRKKILDNAFWMLDVIAAPNFDKKALKVLGKRASRKLLENAALREPELPNSNWHYRQVRGGVLRQPLPHYILDINKTEGDITQLKDTLFDSLVIAWSVTYSSSYGGNEIALVKDRKLIGVGGGPSTVEAAETAVLRAQARGHDTAGSVFAADAFFPFTDAPQILKEAGCQGGIVPSGGKNEILVRRYFQDNSINVIYIPSQFRGFCRH